MPALSDQQFFRIAKALSDPTRFALLQQIAHCDDLACSRLVEKFDVSAPTISHHIKELSSAGLIDARREGKSMHFTLNRAMLDQYFLQAGKKLKR